MDMAYLIANPNSREAWDEVEQDEFLDRVDVLMQKYPRAKAERIARDELRLRELLGDDMGDKV